MCIIEKKIIMIKLCLNIGVYHGNNVFYLIFFTLILVLYIFMHVVPCVLKLEKKIIMIKRCYGR